MNWFSVLGLVGLTVAANVEVILDARYQGANHSFLSRVNFCNNVFDKQSLWFLWSNRTIMSKKITKKMGLNDHKK